VVLLCVTLVVKKVTKHFHLSGESLCSSPMKESAISLLATLTNAHSVPGHEDEVRDVFADELKGLGSLSTDGNGSVVCTKDGEGPHVLLAGHMDEVGFLVQGVSASGFIQFVSVGGWWSHTLLSQRVVIKNRNGKKVMGVIASKPPHFLPESQRRQVLPEDALHIDIGASSRAEVETLGIRLGDPIAPATEFSSLELEDRYVAKAFDNRVGMACAIQAMQELAETDLPNRFSVCGTVQEEVGLRGAVTLANEIEPDVVIVLEGPPADDTPGFNVAEAQGKLGGGVQVRLFDPTAIGNPRLAQFVEKVAEENGINFQLTVRRSGGTDAGSFHKSGKGIPSIVLGTPARYIHSHNAIIDINDYLEMVKLAKLLVQALDREQVDSFTQYL